MTVAAKGNVKPGPAVNDWKKYLIAALCLIALAALCLLSIALAVLAAVCARAVLEGKTMNEEQRQAALLVVVTGVLMAASALRLENGFAPGRILAMLLVMLLAYDRSAGTALAAASG